MNDDPRLTEILRALVAEDDAMRDESQDPSFLLLQTFGAGSELKPDIGLEVTEADIWDLIELGYLREVPATERVRMKFVVTTAGRAAGRSRPVAVALDAEGQPLTSAPPTASLNEVLSWLAALEDNSPSALEDGELLVNQALADLDEARLEGVCRRLIELAGENLIGFVDPGRRLPQLPAAERIALASGFRVTVAGRDRLAAEKASPVMTVNQIINTTNAQVAGRDVVNFVSFGAFLDAAQDQLDQLSDVNDEDRAEAQSIINKLRSATTQIAIGTAAGGGGAVLGAIFTGLLHLHP